MNHETANATQATAGGLRAAVLFDVRGDLRFLSHRDEMRMLMRAATRAQWPLHYSRGFNPQPRISLPLPRPVGQSSTSELAIFWLSEPIADDILARDLSAALPPLAPLRELHCPAGPGSPKPLEADFFVRLDGVDAPLAARCRELMNAPNIWVDRARGPQRAAQRVDVRPFLQELSVEDDGLRMTVKYDDQRSARPAEVLECLGIEDDGALEVCRVRVRWDRPLDGPVCASLTKKGCCIGNEEEHTKHVHPHA